MPGKRLVSRLQTPSLGRGLGVLLATLLAMALVTTVLALRAHRSGLDIDRQARINVELRAYNALLVELLNAETGQRGYLLTGRASYLEPYRHAAAGLDQRLQAVQALYPAGGAAARRIERLRELSRLKLEELAGTLALYDGGRPDAARAMVLSDDGQQLMLELRALLAGSTEPIRAERDALGLKLRQDASQTRLWLSAGLTLLLIFALLAVWQVLVGARRLRATEARLRLLTDQVPALISQFDQQRKLSFVNAHVAAVYGVDRQSLLGKTLAEVRGEAVARQIEPFIERVMRGERVAFESSSTIRGRLHHFHQCYVPDYGPDADADKGGEVQGFFAVAMDISERKNAEARLAANEKKLRAIADNLPVLILYLDAQLRVQFINETFRAWTGREPADALGQLFADVVGPEMYAQRRAGLQQALGGERVQLELFSLINGHYRHLQNIYIPDRQADGTVQGLFVLASDISAMKQAELKLAELARSDTLTGLPNRRQFDECLLQALARNQRDCGALALLFLDIDHFKTINDSHGHGIGDQVLQQFGARLLRSVRSMDMVARLAGDEFVIIVEGLVQPDDLAALAVAGKILQAMATPMLLGEGLVLPVTTSIGVALLPSGAASTPQALMHCADQALYQAKRAGRGRHALLQA
ncbi:MAG: diguanylate cyclase [Burkholderiaceae bacterium]